MEAPATVAAELVVAHAANAAVAVAAAQTLAFQARAGTLTLSGRQVLDVWFRAAGAAASGLQNAFASFRPSEFLKYIELEGHSYTLRSVDDPLR